jgi:hypothetical protein
MRWWRRNAASLVTAGALFGLTAPPATAGPWAPAYVRALPDDAFAVVEARPDGTRARALPHHDAQGWVDGPHLRSALSRLHQVKWLHPTQAEGARQHLLGHLREMRRSAPAHGGRRPPAGP